MKTLLVLVVLIILVGGGYYWYTQVDEPMTPEMTDPFGDTDIPAGPDMNTGAPTGTNMEDGTATDSDAVGTVKAFTVSGQNFSFSPATMTVKRGDTVRITFRNASGTHNLRVDGYDVGTNMIQGGASETFEFVADEAGSFEYYCSVGNHRAMGMVGTLTVTQ